MSYTRCNYAGCGSIKRRSSQKFYRFPTKDEKRLEKWILASGNPRLLEFQPEQLAQMGICEKHFQEDSFINETHHLLVKSAVPRAYVPLVEQAQSASVPEHGQPEPPEMEKQIEYRIALPLPSNIHHQAASSTNEDLIEASSQLASSPSGTFQIMPVTRTYSPSKKAVKRSLFSDYPHNLPPPIKKIRTEEASPEKAFIQKLLSMDTPPKIVDTPRKVKLKQKIATYRKQASKERQASKRLKKKLLSTHPRQH